MKGDDAVSTYLSRATRGLRRHTRQDIASELIGHIEARIQDFKLAGFSDAEALRQTLRELGEPDHVQHGMQRVYVWPAALRTTGLLGALACGSVILLLQLSSVLAQVQGYKPSFTPLPGPYTYVDTLSLREELQKAGVTVTGTPEVPFLTLPGQTSTIRINPKQDDLPNFVNRSLIRDYSSGHSFMDLNAVVRAMIQAGQPAWVEGWLNPKLHLGSVTLALGTPEQPLEAYNLYNVPLGTLARQVGATEPRSSRLDDVNVYSHHFLNVPAKAGSNSSTGELYALVSVQRLPGIWARGKRLVLNFDLAQADANGKLHFQMPYDLTTLQLTRNPDDLKADAGWLSSQAHILNYASATRPAHALLLRLNGKLSGETYQIMPMHALSTGEPY